MSISRKMRLVGAQVLLLLLGASAADAQLTDQTQVGDVSDAPGGTIAKSLEEQIDGGHGDAFTPYSAVYLIKRDPARSIRRGRQLFQRKFTVDQGLGPRVNSDSTGEIRTNRALGAGLADSCAACHGRPRGAAGFGGDVVTRPDSRDAPHLFGLGLVEQLADEMTAKLRTIRATALARAARRGQAITLPLRSKNIKFGRITGFPDGRVNTSKVEGVNPDLRIRPFFHEGATMSIREFIVGALNAEMGLQAVDPLLCEATHPVTPKRVVSPGGMVFDPSLDGIERPAICNPSEDGDFDGVTHEIDVAVVDHMEFYLLNYFKPGTYRQTARTREGLKMMHKIGCTHCHTQNLTIQHDRRIADVDTRYDPANGIFNDLFATASTRFKSVPDGDLYPQLLPEGNPFVVKNIFTDLKRHDLGPNFHEREYDGTLQREFVTEPLWGVGSTAPYGHDGRSINLDQVIRRHGGEARQARNAFLHLSDNQRRTVLEFLESLVLFPPDDTASNLNPGDPSGDPQTSHGSINLRALFQIDLGPE